MTKFILAFAISSSLLSIARAQDTPNLRSACPLLTNNTLDLENTTISSAEIVEANSFRQPGRDSNLMTPAFCRVVGSGMCTDLSTTATTTQSYTAQELSPGVAEWTRAMTMVIVLNPVDDDGDDYAASVWILVPDLDLVYDDCS